MNLEIITETPESNPHEPPILFIHGMYHGAWCWENFLPYFARHGYISHAVSLRGHGASEKSEPLKWASIDDYVEDVTQVIHDLHISPVLVGHSMGGMVVQKYLQNNDTPAAILLGSAYPSGPKYGINRVLKVMFHFPRETLKARVTLNLLPIVNEVSRYKTLFFSDNVPEKDLQSYVSRINDESLRAAAEMIYGRINPELVSTPLLVLGAANDFLVSPKEIEATARVYKTTHKIFPGMAHNMMLETNWQKVADYMITWLKNKL
ncbi:MAG: alpha/beta fold hydrolase [Candidatus Methanofastidiosia archaeon]|jgi:pimeloyl-ACP methyl ester carboxylesterase